jgi:hypothetical protein
MKTSKVAKKILFFTLALLIGLSIGMRILEAHSPNSDIPVPTEVVSFKENDHSIRDVLESSFRRMTHQSDSVGSFASVGQLRQAMPNIKRTGKPIAVLADEELLTVDNRGRFLAFVDSIILLDLPVITSNLFTVDMKDKKLIGKEFEQCLQFLRYSEKSPLLFAQISEVHVSKENGIICYLATSQGLPVVLGMDDMERKVEYLAVFLDKFFDAAFLQSIKYVDLRFSGQILLKKRT